MWLRFVSFIFLLVPLRVDVHGVAVAGVGRFAEVAEVFVHGSRQCDPIQTVLTTQYSFLKEL